MKLSNNSTSDFDFGKETIVFLKFTKASSLEQPYNSYAGADLSIS
ncbi:MAG: hypothetical protein RIM68_08535 [Arenibacter sp.]|jgi:hypothetical protein